MRLMVTGAAPVSASVLTFLRTALGCQVSFLALILKQTFIPGSSFDVGAFLVVSLYG